MTSTTPETQPGIAVHDRFFADGRFEAATSGRSIDIVSPRTEEPIARVALASAADVDRAVAAARAAFDQGPWPRMTPAERAATLRRLADGLEARAGELVALGVDEMGYPIAFSEAYMGPNPVFQFRRYAELAESYAFEEERRGTQRSLVLREPVGVVAAIPPFNGPLTLGAQKAAPALAAGCTVILKAPNQDPLACFVLAEVAEQAGLPPGVLNVLVADVPESERLVAHPGVDMVSFTGSTAVGRRVAEACGRDIRRVTLELGGKSAAIVLEDADFAQVVPGLVGCSVAMINGEICTMQSRILAPRARYDELVDGLAGAIAALPVGDPRDRGTAVGPLITSAHRERVEAYIAIGREEGARVVTGGGRPPHLDHGWYLEPTLFADATNAMRIAREEIFGPVVTVIPHDGVDDAVAIANDSPFGLSGTVWTQDADAALGVARRVRTGTFSINTYTVDPDTPFGGFKQSGIGREMAREGLDEFVELKSIALSGPALA
jgi:betaine-aldehyde dehydrogenase